MHKITGYYINIINGERWQDKASTVKEWMARDRFLQERYDSAEPKRLVFCKDCQLPTKIVSTTLMDSSDEDPKVLFIFECKKCRKRQAFYDDGTEFVFESEKCPKCGAELNIKTENIEDVLTTIYSCPKCTYAIKEVSDLKKPREESAQKQAYDQELLNKYREHFCWDDEKGEQYIFAVENITRIKEEQKAQARKEKDPRYQKAEQLKKLTVNQLKELITKIISDDGYNDLQFGKPDMGKDVIIEFTVNETKDGREGRVSEKALNKLLNKGLEDTNWRLMSEGVSYRLGILSGRLRAYETDEQLMEVLKDLDLDS